MVNKEPYCYAPWIGLNITTGSNVDHEKQNTNTNYMYTAPCCAWQGKFYNGPIEELYESKYWKKIIKDMEEHNIDNLKKSCQECIQIEKSNLKSDREDTTNKVKSGMYFPGELNCLDYRPSNTCNLRCRMCSPENSNLIAKDENVNIHISNDEDIYKLDLSNLKILKILGGEPTIQKETYNFANYVIKNYDTDDLWLSYTTNMTVLNQNWLDLLKKFKKVYCYMSIDGTGKIFEYIRQGAKWKIVENNIKKLYNFSKNYIDFEIEFHVTVGAILMLTVKEWLPWFIKNDHVEANFYPLYGNPGGPISILKEQEKEKIKNDLNKFNHVYADSLLSLLSSESYNPKALNDFKKINVIKDKLFNTDIKNLHPTLKKMFDE